MLAPSGSVAAAEEILMDRLSQKPLAGAFAVALLVFLAALMLSAGPEPNTRLHPSASGAPEGGTPPPQNGTEPPEGPLPPDEQAWDVDHGWLALRVLLDPGQERTVAVPCAENQTVAVTWFDENGTPFNFTVFANEGDLHLDFEVFLTGSNMTEWEGRTVQSVNWTDSPNRTFDNRDDVYTAFSTRAIENQTDEHLDHHMACRSLQDGDKVVLEFGATLHLDDGTVETLDSKVTFVRAEASMADVWNWEQGESCPIPACG